MPDLYSYILECHAILSYEQSLLHRILYKNKFQYHTHIFYKRNVQVNKSIKYIITLLQHISTSHKRNTDILQNVLDELLDRLYYTVYVIDECLNVTLYQLSNTYFMNINTLTLAINSRFNTIIRQLFMYTIQQYQIVCDTFTTFKSVSVTEWLYTLQHNHHIKHILNQSISQSQHNNINQLLLNQPDGTIHHVASVSSSQLVNANITGAHKLQLRSNINTTKIKKSSLVKTIKKNRSVNLPSTSTKKQKNSFLKVKPSADINDIFAHLDD